MRSLSVVLSFFLFGSLIIPVTGIQAEQKGVPYFGREDSTKYIEVKNFHGGHGSVYYMDLVGSDIFEANLLYIRAGKIPPKSGIGEHKLINMDVIYYISNGPVQVTVNGQTALLPARSAVECPMGSSIGIYNNSDKTLEWLCIAGSEEEGKGDALDLGTDLVNAKIESAAPFNLAQFDISKLPERGSAHDGKGSLFYTNLRIGAQFKFMSLSIMHALIPPDCSIGYHQHVNDAELYHVLLGSGRLTVNDYTWDVKPNDSFPCTFRDKHGIYNNTDKNLEILILFFPVKNPDGKNINLGDDLSGR